MTDKKQLALGDTVTTKSGRKGKIVQLSSNGQAALVNGGDGKEFSSDWFQTDTLKASAS